MNDAPSRANDRLYQELARKLTAELVAGTWPVGSRLPAERELAALHNVSRPTVREAIIALEVQGLVEVRVGSGAYVLRHPGEEDIPGFGMSAFELTEARLLIERETAALAATQIEAAELAEIERLVGEIARAQDDPREAERADRAFHLAIAAATRNSGLLGAVRTLWDLRESSAESALLHAKARTANVKPVVEEHAAIVEALRARDAAAARDAMHAHLSAVLESLLFATEQSGADHAASASRPRREGASER